MTMHTSPDAGWYGDPTGGAGLRYWDGAAWTDATQATPAAGGYQPTGNYQPTGGYPTNTGYPANTGYQPTTPGYPAASPYPGAAGAPAPRPATSFLARNRFFLITLAICVIYALVATFSHFVFFGVLPVLYTVRSFQAKEPLAVAALIATCATIFFSLQHIYG